MIIFRHLHRASVLWIFPRVQPILRSLSFVALAGVACWCATIGPAAAQTLAPLITPYVDEADMASILQVFNTNPVSNAAYGSLGYLHDGLDIAPKADLKPFRAVCSGRVRWILTFDDGVNLMLDCNSTYTVEYNFEPQAPHTGQTQLAHISVVKGQLVAQGDRIGSLYVANAALAHVHFGVHKDWFPTCAQSYLDSDAASSISRLVQVHFPGADMCQGPAVTPALLSTPYVNESDMASVDRAFSADGSAPPWNALNDGIDMLPRGSLKPFRASCSGVVDSVQLQLNSLTANWQVVVMIGCSLTIPNNGGYFSPLELVYTFEPMSTLQSIGQTQLANITVAKGQAVAQNDVIGHLLTEGAGAYLRFGTIPFGDHLTMGIPIVPVCPGPHFSAAAGTSILNLLHVARPGASICYEADLSAASILNLVPSWNLLGNSRATALTVATSFGDPSAISSVWKWLANTSKWALYTPTLGDGGQAYATGYGYEPLVTINPGEGFWVYAKAAYGALLPTAAGVASSNFKPAGGTHALAQGWSLIATGDAPTPSQFDLALGTPTNLTSLWAWDSARQRWYFWAPNLANSGSLASYISTRNYLDFASNAATPAGTLAPMTGFWVNMP